MEAITVPAQLPLSFFSRSGGLLLDVLLALSLAAGGVGLCNIFSARPRWSRAGGLLLLAVDAVFLAGFLLICWFHYRIHVQLPLELPAGLAGWLNQQLTAMNSNASYTMPLYDISEPPRYSIPVWIENEKYFFWFFCYGVMALFAYRRLEHHRYRGMLLVLLAVQVVILFLFADPFTRPLPRFFAEISPWFSGGGSAMQRLGLFMQLYPRQVFYYNAHYMWFHPPLLFLAYASLTLTFLCCLFMLATREPAVEQAGYEYAKFGFFMLTLGMLLGYPWALQAWGPNWWWDPKICSSIMMWAVFSTYLHTRLYVHRPGMWYFASFLGVLSFLAMLFTFLSSYFFPGEHTFQ